MNIESFLELVFFVEWFLTVAEADAVGLDFTSCDIVGVGVGVKVFDSTGCVAEADVLAEVLFGAEMTGGSGFEVSRTLTEYDLSEMNKKINEKINNAASGGRDEFILSFDFVKLAAFSPTWFIKA